MPIAVETIHDLGDAESRLDLCGTEGWELVGIIQTGNVRMPVVAAMRRRLEGDAPKEVTND